MTAKMVTNGENKEPSKGDVYQEFILWYAMPPSERYRLGIENQDAFIEHYGLGINTPARWKQRKDFRPRVDAIRNEWALSKTGSVIEAIYVSALKGNASSQRLWLQYFCDFREKHDIKQEARNLLHPDDIFALIEALPEPLKTKHYTAMRELLDDASASQEHIEEYEKRETQEGKAVEATPRPMSTPEAVVSPISTQYAGFATQEEFEAYANSL